MYLFSTKWDRLGLQFAALEIAAEIVYDWPEQSGAAQLNKYARTTFGWHSGAESGRPVALG